MTGPEHYQKAERLLREAGEASNPDGEMSDAEVVQFIASTMAAAQVHATLALAAATALSNSCDLPSPDWRAWYAVAAAPKPGTEGER